jgi:hypothetical protein
MSKKKIIVLVCLFSVVAVVGRFVPRPWNFTPMGSLFIFSGFFLPRRLFWVPFLALILTDFFIGTYSYQIMLAVYFSYFVSFVFSSLARKKYSFSLAVGFSALGSVIFFFVTNLAVWAWSGMYPLNYAGLFASFYSGIPFFRNSFLGYLFYTTVFFGVYEVVRLLDQKKIQEFASLSK